jgi:two-component system, chemotaxis family, chemotaxis protein CheY
MRNILVVDDSATMRRMVIASLRQIGKVSFTEAGSGLEAIEKLALDRFELMILDLNMPDIHGMEVLQFVQGHQSFRKIPVIVLTTKGDEKSRSDAFALGASYFMTKPFNPVLLAKQAKELLENKR